jgi:superfamily II DNA or RNA helicase
MNQKIQITIIDGVLKIVPFPEYLKAPLSFHDLVQVMEPFSYRKKGTGEIVTGERRAGYKNETRPLYTELQEIGGAVTHRGLFRRVLSLVGQNQDEAVVECRDHLPSFTFSPEVVRGLREEQVRVVLKVLSEVGTGQKGWQNNPRFVKPHPGSGGALIEATMSTGKTHIIGALIRCFPDVKILVVTKKKSVVKRLVDGLSELITSEPVGVFFGPKKDPRRITVCSEALLDSFDTSQIGLILYDEVHNASGEVVSNILLQFDRAIKVGLSGTLSSHKKKKFIESIFGPIVDTITDEEADEKGLVSPIKIYALHVPKGPDVSGHADVALERWGITKNVHRNKLIAQVVQLVPPDMQMIVFVRTIDHIEELLEKLPPGFVAYHGQLSDSERSRIEAGVMSGNIKRLVANDSYSEGVDTTKLRVMVEAGWSINDETVSQRAGRNRRRDAGKNLGVVITFLDDWEIPCQVEGMSKKNPLKDRALSRIRNYTKRGWPVLKINDPKEIDFSEIQDPAMTGT